jgi:hypothetical protein
MQRSIEVGVRPHRNDWLVVQNSRIMKRRKSGYAATTFSDLRVGFQGGAGDFTKLNSPINALVV